MRVDRLQRRPSGAVVMLSAAAEGPFPSRRSFDEYLERNAASRDPLFFSIVSHNSETAVGFAAYLRIDRPHRVIEVSHVLFTHALQRTTEATEAMYLTAKHVFEDLGYPATSGRATP